MTLFCLATFEWHLVFFFSKSVDFWFSQNWCDILSFKLTFINVQATTLIFFIKRIFIRKTHEWILLKSLVYDLCSIVVFPPNNRLRVLDPRPRKQRGSRASLIIKTKELTFKILTRSRLSDWSPTLSLRWPRPVHRSGQARTCLNLGRNLDTEAARPLRNLHWFPPGVPLSHCRFSSPLEERLCVLSVNQREDSISSKTNSCGVLSAHVKF